MKTRVYMFLARISVNKTYFGFFLRFKQLCSHIIKYSVVRLTFPVTLPPLPLIREARNMKDEMQSRQPHSCKALMKGKEKNGIK